MQLSKDVARRALEDLIAKYNSLTPEDVAAHSEQDVVNGFITALFSDVLGWPTRDTKHFRMELHTEGGRPDITLLLDGRAPLFVEAKRFGKIEPLAVSRQSAAYAYSIDTLDVQSMTADRTKEEQQAINYAFKTGGQWAILTNFERFRLFNARRDTLVYALEAPSAYLDEFDWLWDHFAYDNIQAGSLDALVNLRHRADVDESYLEFINRYRKLLAQDLIHNIGANLWLTDEYGRVRRKLLRGVVQRLLDRLVLIRYAEDHLVMPPDTLAKVYELVRVNFYAAPLTHQLNAVFRRFDWRHNSSLFAEHLVDSAVFSDDEELRTAEKRGAKSVLGHLIDELYTKRYRAMTPDILGNTYEQYLGQRIDVDVDDVRRATVVLRDNLETRKKQGSYYTPQVIVQYIVDHSLGRYLYGTADGKPDGEPLPDESPKTAADIRGLRVLDNACGSGSFLIYAYQVLAGFYQRELDTIDARRAATIDDMLRRRQAGEAITNMDIEIATKDFDLEKEHLQNYALIILQEHIYGVDLDPQAAEIASMNLIMRALERQETILPLILGHTIKVGNALVGIKPDDERLVAYAPQLAKLKQLRHDLTHTDHRHPGHQTIKRTLDELAAEVSAALNAEMGLDTHFDDLERVTPFHWAVEFPEVFVGDDGAFNPASGFTIIVGNPPWEIVKPEIREFFAQFDPDIESRLTRAAAERRIEALIAENPVLGDEWEAKRAAIAQDAEYYNRSGVYTRQGRGDNATHKLFLERNYGILRDKGYLGYVIPSGIYSDLGTKELREMLLTEGRLQHIYSFSNERYFFPGVDHRFKFALIGAQKGVAGDGFWTAFRFNPRVAVAPKELPTFLADESNLVYFRRDSIARFNPDSLSIMEFQSRRDYEIADKIYGEWPLIGDEVEDTWNIRFAYEFHMSNDRELFNTRKIGLPLYEGKMIHQFDAAFGEPQYWLDEKLASQRLVRKESSGWYTGYRLAFREISNATNQRTVISTILPPNSFSAHTLWVGMTPHEKTLLYSIGIMNSLCFDWLARFQVGTHVTLFVMKSLPMPRLDVGDPYFDAIVERAARLVCVREEFAELWQSVTGREWSAQDGATDPAERTLLRDEIDALVARLYGLSALELEHILGTFPLVFPDNAEGAAKKSALLETFAAMG